MKIQSDETDQEFTFEKNEKIKLATGGIISKKIVRFTPEPSLHNSLLICSESWPSVAEPDFRQEVSENHNLSYHINMNHIDM